MSAAIHDIENALAAIIVRHLERIGYAVGVNRINDTLEMHAVLLRDPNQFQVVRCNGGSDSEKENRAAWLLAEAVGIDLEG